MPSGHLRLKKETQGQFLPSPRVWRNNNLNWGVAGAKGGRGVMEKQTSL